MMETGQLFNQFKCLIGSAKRPQVHRMVSAITERKKFVGGGKTAWCVVLKVQTIKKYGLKPLEVDAAAEGRAEGSAAPSAYARATRGYSTRCDTAARPTWRPWSRTAST